MGDNINSSGGELVWLWVAANGNRISEYQRNTEDLKRILRHWRRRPVRLSH